MTKRRICVFTGTRAEYGLLSWLLRELAAAPGVTLQLLVAGSHLSGEFGSTIQEIERDGFGVDDRVEMLLSSDSAVGVTKSMGLGTIGFADALQRLRPDLAVVLGDRYETLAFAQAALVARIPLAHIGGGEVTEGAIDDAIRHAVTKLAHLHFTATEAFRRRVLQLGEDPCRVFAVGALGVDAVLRTRLLDRRDTEAALGCRLTEPTILVTYHPATLGVGTPAAGIGALLEALDAFPEATVLFTKPNADTRGREVVRAVEAYAIQHAHRVRGYASLGQHRYLSALRHADALIGIFSSGLEAPALRTATVNGGMRQRGRPRADSVVQAPETAGGIADAVRHALSPAFRERVAGVSSPYGDGRVAPRIAAVLARAPLEGIVVKRFHDRHPGWHAGSAPAT